MKEPYGEGLANHPGPESCIETSQEAGEALTGEARAGLLSFERNEYQVLLLWRHRGGETCWDVKGESQWDLAESETPSKRGRSMDENRETPGLSVWMAGGPAGEGKPQCQACTALGSRTDP